MVDKVLSGKQSANCLLFFGDDCGKSWVSKYRLPHCCVSCSEDIMDFRFRREDKIASFLFLF